MQRGSSSRGRPQRAPRKALAFRAGSDRRGAITHPPQIASYGITRDVRLRFVTSAAVPTASITYQNLLDIVLVAATTTAGYDLYDAVRVNSVEAWACPVTGAPVTVTTVFNGEILGAQGDLKVHTDTSMGIEPAHVKCRPEPLSQAAQFQASSGDTVFTIICPASTVVDVSLSLRQPILGQSTAAQNALVGATVGALYFRGLDGKALAATNFPILGAYATI
jgi:hypothetical protein